MAVCELRKIVEEPLGIERPASKTDEGRPAVYRAEPMIAADPVVLLFMNVKEFEKYFCGRCLSQTCDIRLKQEVPLSELDDTE